jgi:hypothetical protein
MIHTNIRWDKQLRRLEVEKHIITNEDRKQGCKPERWPLLSTAVSHWRWRWLLGRTRSFQRRLEVQWVSKVRETSKCRMLQCESQNIEFILPDPLEWRAVKVSPKSVVRVVTLAYRTARYRLRSPDVNRIGVEAFAENGTENEALDVRLGS